MTKLNKDVSRESNTIIRDRGKDRILCVTLKKGNEKYGDFIELRPKGTQVKYTVTMEELYSLGQAKIIRSHGL
jgi:hypothetical protein